VSERTELQPRALSPRQTARLGAKVGEDQPAQSHGWRVPRDAGLRIAVEGDPQLLIRSRFRRRPRDPQGPLPELRAARASLLATWVVMPEVGGARLRKVNAAGSSLRPRIQGSI